MEWQPVSEDRFRAILDQEILELPSEAAKILKNHSIPLYRHPCIRYRESEIEKVFVVARSGDRLLFYDDVEEDFGVGVPHGDGILRDLGTCGPLAAAVLALGKAADETKLT